MSETVVNQKTKSRHIRNRELTVIAVMTAISVLSRWIFYSLPEIKPIGAIVIITGASLGAVPGFIVGALTMLISNILYGQGIWTIFQMAGLGLTGFFSGIIFKNFKYERRRDVVITAIIGGLLIFIIYGLLADTSGFIYQNQFNIASVVAVYASGIPFNLIFGISTAIFLLLFTNELSKKLTRMRKKYGIFR